MPELLVLLIALGLGLTVAPWLLPLMRRPTIVVVLALVSVLYARTVVHLLNAPVASNLDDAATGIVVAFGIVAWGRNKPSQRRKFPGAPWFVLFAALGFLSGALNGVPLGLLTNATWLALKGVLFGWAVAQFDWDEAAINRLIKTGAINGTFCIATLALNLAAPSAWASTFSVNGGQIVRYGLPSLSGPFIHPFDLAFISGLTLVGAVVYRRQFGPSAWNWFLIGGSAFGLVGSLRRKDLIGSGLALGAVAVRGRRWGAVIGGSLLVACVVIVAWGPIGGQVRDVRDSYFSAESEEARTVLTLRSFDVASSYLPLGAGFGRYGSRVAASNYSPEYEALGFHEVYGLGSRPGDGAFLTDTSWPAIIGEAGYFGLLAFALGLVAITRFLLRAARRASDPHRLWLCSTSLGALVLYLVESSGAAVFTSPPAFPFVFCLVGVAASAMHARGRQGPPAPVSTVIPSVVNREPRTALAA